MMKTNFKSMDSTPDYNYFNIVVANPASQSSPNYVPGNDILLQYNLSMSEAILDNPKDYYGSIIRFSIPGSNIPVQIVPCAEYLPYPTQTIANSNAELLTYSVGFNTPGDATSSVGYSAQVIWQPQGTDGIPLAPSQNNGKQQITPFYYLYDYQHLIDLINIAMGTAWTLYAAAHAGAGAIAPYFTFDSATSLFSLILPYSFTTLATNFIMDASLQALFNGFDWGIAYTTPGTANPVIMNQAVYWAQPVYVFEGTSYSPTANYQINAYALPGAAITTPPAYLRFYQQWVSLEYWNSFQDIVFLTSSIPINSEALPIGLASIQSSSLNLMPIITDFCPVLSTAGDPQSIIQYFQTGPYRLADLLSTVPLKNISMSVFWLDKQNNIYPIQISPGQTATIKLMFAKKSAIKGVSK